MQIFLNAKMAIDRMGYLGYSLPMLFLLNHATGALVLHAEDRKQVLSWSHRQLGPHALQASVVELDENVPEDWVEKSGTGIKRALVQGCEAKLSFMADSVQGLDGLRAASDESMPWYRKGALRSRKTAVN